MSQIGIPVEIPFDQLLRVKSFGQSMSFCAQIAGYDLDKTLQQELGVDKAQFSRWTNNTEGVNWAKLSQLMDFCGNDAPLCWMLNERGYDVHSVRKKLSVLEKQLAEKDRQLLETQQELNVLKKHLVVLKD